MLVPFYNIFVFPLSQVHKPESVFYCVSISCVQTILKFCFCKHMKALTVFLLYMPLISLVGHLSSFLLLLFNVQALSFLNMRLFRRCLDYNSTVLFVLWFSFRLAHHVQALLKWRPLYWGYLLWFQGVNPDLIVLRVISGVYLFLYECFQDVSGDTDLFFIARFLPLEFPLSVTHMLMAKVKTS